MKFSLSIAFITGREHPCVDWFVESLLPQLHAGEKVDVIIIDFFAEQRTFNPPHIPEFNSVRWVEPKPTIWQGRYKIPKDQWWAASGARNTSICLCETEWLAFLDDRCVLAPTWLQSIRHAMDENYAVCGAYEKRINMKVEKGVIVNQGTVTGTDNRLAHANPNQPTPCAGNWWYGCTGALPLEWALKINGYEELMDSLSFEDCIFGMMLSSNGFPIRYDPKMLIVEDRTVEFLGKGFKRSSKERFPHDKEDKGHKALERFGKAKSADNFGVNLSGLRTRIARGESFPPPPDREWVDWFDGQPVKEF